MESLYSAFEVPLFLILDCSFFHNFLENDIFKKQIISKENKNISFLQRIFIEDLFIFMNSRLFFSSNQNLFVILSNQTFKPIFINSLKKFRNSKENRMSCRKIKKNWFEEILIYELENEALRSKGLNRKQSLVSAFFIIFSTLKKIGFDKKKKGFRILTIGQNGNEKYGLDIFRKLILIGRKMNGIFDSLVLSHNNLLLNNLAFRTTGIYCKPTRILADLAYSKDLIQIFVSFFLLNKNCRQFFNLGFPSKISRTLILPKNEKEKWYCSTCFSSFFFPLTSCYLCGAFFFTIN